MAEADCRGVAALTVPIGVGVFWFIWGHYGFWWGVLYGLSWPFWVGYKLAAFLVTR